MFQIEIKETREILSHNSPQNDISVANQIQCLEICINICITNWPPYCIYHVGDSWQSQGSLTAALDVEQ